MDVTALSSSTDLLNAMNTAWQPVDVSTLATASSLFGLPTDVSVSATSSTSTDTSTVTALDSVLAQVYGNAAAPGFKLSQAQLDEINQARSLRDQGDYDGARSILTGMLQDNPNNGFAAHALGTVATAQQNYKEAEKWFTRANFYAPGRGYDTDADTARILQKDDATVLATARQYLSDSSTATEGQSLLAELSKRNPDLTEAHLVLADHLIKTGDAANGLLQYRSAILGATKQQLHQIETTLTNLAARSPTAAYVRQLLGRTQLALGETDQAKKTLQTAADLSNNDESYQKVVGQAYDAAGNELISSHNFQAAITELKQALSINSKDTAARQGLAVAYQAIGKHAAELGDFKGAIAALTSAQTNLNAAGTAAQKKDLATLFYSVGRQLESRHLVNDLDVGQEAQAYQSAYDLDHTNNTYRIRLATVRERAGDEFLAKDDLVNAAGAYRRAFLLRKGNSEYRETFVTTLNKLGAQQLADKDYNSAIASFKEAYTTDKSNEASQSNLAGAYNTRGLTYLAKDDKESALADFKAALALYPDNAEYLDNYKKAGGT